MNYTSEAIITGLQQKDQQVLQYLYRTYGGMIAGHVRKNSGSDGDAQEMVQVTILELWIAVQEGRYQEQGKLDQYIYQLAANSWREELRRRRNRPQNTLDDSALQIEDEGEENLARAIVKDRYLQAMHEGIAQLGEPCQEIIQLYHLKKVNLQEVAARMQYDYDNLRKRIFDCRKKLKKIVEQFIS
jgi:RNA polymerase sigma factor (sigma-70 family)